MLFALIIAQCTGPKWKTIITGYVDAFVAKKNHRNYIVKNVYTFINQFILFRKKGIMLYFAVPFFNWTKNWFQLKLHVGLYRFKLWATATAGLSNNARALLACNPVSYLSSRFYYAPSFCYWERPLARLYVNIIFRTKAKTPKPYGILRKTDGSSCQQARCLVVYVSAD